MTATATRITCSDCGRELTDPDEQRTGLCTDDLARWFAETVIDIPNRQHPTSHDINRIVAKHAAIGSAMRALHPKDAAREAAHGYSIEHELRQIGPELSDVCGICGGTGWYESDCREYAIECPCQVVGS